MRKATGNADALVRPLDEDQNERAAKIEEHKQAQLKDAKANQGKWRDELASDSESAVGIRAFPIKESG